MTDISNMISELARAKDALELVPKLQTELNNTKYDLERAQQNVEDRELAIINYKREIDELHAKVRSLEVERDDAGFHALEADDRAAKALKLVRTAMDQLDQTVMAIEPPKPEPTPVVEAVRSIEDVGQAPQHEPSNEPWQAPIWGETSTTQAAPPMQAAVDPGPAVGDAFKASEDVESSTRATAPINPEPYAGKRYIDIPGYVSRFDWLSGGGTEDDYDYRG